MPACRHPIFLQGIKVPIIGMHRVLGVMLDQELQGKIHINYTLQKGTKWVFYIL